MATLMNKHFFDIHSQTRIEQCVLDTNAQLEVLRFFVRSLKEIHKTFLESHKKFVRSSKEVCKKFERSL
jgi:hypothetical protein